MCLIQTGVVVSCGRDAAVVSAEGRERLVTSLLVPDLRVGDLVLVGMGTVFARTTSDEATEIDRLTATATGADRPVNPTRHTDPGA